MRNFLFASLLIVGLALPAAAQDTDPVAEAPIHLGPVGLAPQFAITNLGVDTNVFNEVSDPKSDFTFTTSPGVDLWLRTARGLLSVSGNLDFVYFSKYDSERSINGLGTAQYEYRFNRVRPFVSFSALNTRQRPGFEIDVRARRFDSTLRAGADVRIGGKTRLELAGRRQDVSYAGDAVFNGQPLNKALNRTLNGVDLTFRKELTVLTTWVVRGSAERERFEFETTRNADSTRFETGFELGQFALVRGNVFVGYRRLVSADGGDLPEFSGITADIDATYTAPTRTRLNLGVTRDVQYSYELANPYYIQTGWTVTATQAVVGRWDVQLSGGRDRLTYEGALLSTGDQRRDRIDRIGGGIGYNLGQTVRIGLDVQSFQRQSELPGRDYKTLRAGVSVSYGFQ